MLSEPETEWVSKINRAAKNRVGDIFKVRVGIKTTADKVFISENWDDQYYKPEKELLKQLISQENIEPWGATVNTNLKVLYPHYSIEGVKQTIELEEYPEAVKYFKLHEETLRKRKYVIDAGRQWYEIWVPHKPDNWKLPKLVFPDISPIPRFYFDSGGKIVNGNCYWIMGRDEKDLDRLFLVQGVANSKLMTRYHDLVFKQIIFRPS